MTARAPLGATTGQDLAEIFTHGSGTRWFVLLLFTLYTGVFCALSFSFRQRVGEMRSLPSVFQDPDQTFWALLLGALLWLLCFALLLLLLAAVLDVWGLQVHLGERHLIVVNTLTGTFLVGVFGVGVVDLAGVSELRGRSLFTEVASPHGRVHFTPVQQVERLITLLHERIGQWSAAN
jgi:hypothetical protein